MKNLALATCLFAICNSAAAGPATEAAKQLTVENAGTFGAIVNVGHACRDYVVINNEVIAAIVHQINNDAEFYEEFTNAIPSDVFQVYLPSKYTIWSLENEIEGEWTKAQKRKVACAAYAVTNPLIDIK